MLTHLSLQLLVLVPPLLVLLLPRLVLVSPLLLVSVLVLLLQVLLLPLSPTWRSMCLSGVMAHHRLVWDPLL